MPWEERRVLSPSVVTLPADELDSWEDPVVGVLSMWYAAGPRGQERIGCARREIPARIVRPTMGD
jgi:hypothetical protein